VAESTVAVPVAIRYRAFLSYSHADTAWAKWLHAALEGFRIDKDLVGRNTPLGPVPKTLRPIFRDREDFSGGHALTDATVAALDASSALIVLCSPVAAGRPAVNEEVRLFRSRNSDRPVIPVVVDGVFPDNFPPALRYAIASDGTVTDQPVTILGPDLRESGDGKLLGLAKVVAGLIGVSSDDIFRRAERARRRRNRFWAGLAGVFLLLAVGTTVSAVYAWHQLKTNEAFLNASLKRAAEIVDEAVAQAEKYNVPRKATLALLARAEGLFDDMAQFGRPTPELRHRKAWMLIQFARNYEILGDSGKQRARATEAHRLLADLTAEKPENLTYQRELSVALDEVGNVLLAQGNLAEALTSYHASLAIAERLAKADPGNAGCQRDLSVSYNNVGNVLLAQGNLAEALTSFQASLAIRERLAQVDPGNAGWQHDLSVSYERVGDVQVAQSNLAEGLTSRRASLVINERLAKADPSNARWQRGLAESYIKVGEVLVAQGNLAEALTSFEASLAIRKRLAQADPDSAGWQRDLLVSYGKVGELLLAQGNLAEALTSFQASLAINERLAKAEPGNASWQHDLSVSYHNVGEVLLAQGSLADGLTSLRASLAIRERLAKVDPGNAQWRWSVIVSHWRLAEHGDEPARQWAFVVAAMRKLREENRLRPDWARYLPIAEKQLATFKEVQAAPQR